MLFLLLMLVLCGWHGQEELLCAWLKQEQLSLCARESSLCASGRYLHPAVPLTCGKALHSAQAQHVPSQGLVPSPSPWRTGRKSQKASTGYFPSREKLYRDSCNSQNTRSPHLLPLSLLQRHFIIQQ